MAKRRKFKSEFKSIVVVEALSAEARIGIFIGQVCNQKRLHPALGNHLTSVECEQQYSCSVHIKMMGEKFVGWVERSETQHIHPILPISLDVTDY